MSGQIRIFALDLNYASLENPRPLVSPSSATDWRAVDHDGFVQWQITHGANVVSCQPWTFSGFATFPTELGPRLTGSAGTLFPAAYERARSLDLPIQGYFNVGADLIVCATRPHWVLPGSRNIDILGDTFVHGFLDPQSSWADLLDERIVEFLTRFPVDWLLFDWFCYGSLLNDLPLPQTTQVRYAFTTVVGKPFPGDPIDVHPDDAVTFKRALLARWFRRIQETVKKTSPATMIMFNVPYFAAAEPVWDDHPMLRESDALFAESSNADIVEWLLAVRQPGQRVMTTIHGRPDDHVDGTTIRWSDAATWRHWSDRDCDLMAWTFPVPPGATPHRSDSLAINTVAGAYRRLASEREAK